MKIIINTPEKCRNDPNFKYEWVLESISKHYRIPVIKVKELLEVVKELKDD